MKINVLINVSYKWSHGLQLVLGKLGNLKHFFYMSNALFIPHLYHYRNKSDWVELNKLILKFRQASKSN